MTARSCPAALFSLTIVALLVGCGAVPSDSRPAASITGTPGAPAGAGNASANPTAPRAAREGTEAAGSRIRFVPEVVVLPDGTRAPVNRAATAGGVLQVPESVQRVGWWDGSAYPGDPFGSTVVAGHVDSARQGLGVFALLLDVEPGAQVTLQGGGHAATYRVTSVSQVDKDALATSSGAFDQLGGHRLVLITCTGDFDPQRRSYDQNLVVVAEPTGPVS